MEKTLRVTGVLMDCDAETCTLQVTLEDGSMVTWKSIPAMKAGMALMSAYQNGITATYEEEMPPDNNDAFKLQNLKAELAAAEANLIRKKQLAEDESAPDMARHQANINSIFLEWRVEDLTNEIKELERNE